MSYSLHTHYLYNMPKGISNYIYGSSQKYKPDKKDEFDDDRLEIEKTATDNEPLRQAVQIREEHRERQAKEIKQHKGTL